MMAKQKGQPVQSAFYQDSLAHLVDELGDWTCSSGDTLRPSVRSDWLRRA